MKKFISVLLSAILLSLPLVANAAGYGDNNATVPDDLGGTANYLDLVSTSKYQLKDGFVLNVPKGTAKSDFINNFQNSTKVSVSDSTLKTGVTVQYDTQADDKHIVVISGDIDCNGQVTVSDILAVSDHILGKSHLAGKTAKFHAADLNRNGAVDIADINAIRAEILP